MVDKKTGSLVKISNDYFQIEAGTLNKKKPTVVYYEGGIYIAPKENKTSYIDDIEVIENELQYLAKITIKEIPFTENQCIFISNVADGRINIKRQTYFSFQLHIRLKDDFLNGQNFKAVLTELAPFMEKLFTDFASTISNNGFSGNKTKKESYLSLNA